MRRLSVIALCASTVFAGCFYFANPYEKFYSSTVGGKDPQSLPAFEPCDGSPQIFSSLDITRDAQELERQGYSPIGYASFSGNANNATESNIMAQALSVSACRILTSGTYVGTAANAFPLFAPDDSDAQRDAATAGNGGYAGTGVSADDSQTLMMPSGVPRYAASAMFFIKTKLANPVLAP